MIQNFSAVWRKYFRHSLDTVFYASKWSFISPCSSFLDNQSNKFAFMGNTFCEIFADASLMQDRTLWGRMFCYRNVLPPYSNLEQKVVGCFAKIFGRLVITAFFESGGTFEKSLFSEKVIVFHHFRTSRENSWAFGKYFSAFVPKLHFSGLNEWMNNLRKNVFFPKRLFSTFFAHWAKFFSFLEEYFHRGRQNGLLRVQTITLSKTFILEKPLNFSVFRTFINFLFSFVSIILRWG